MGFSSVKALGNGLLVLLDEYCLSVLVVCGAPKQGLLVLLVEYCLSVLIVCDTPKYGLLVPMDCGTPK